MEQQDRKFINFEEMVQKAVNKKAKAGLKSSTIVRDSDIRCPQGYCPFNSTALKVQIQGIIAKDFSRLEELKAKETKFVRIDMAEPLEQDKKDKKDRQNKKQKFQKRRERNNTSATSNNTVDALKKKKKNWDCDISGVTYYNCNKKCHFANTYTKPKN